MEIQDTQYGYAEVCFAYFLSLVDDRRGYHTVTDEVPQLKRVYFVYF